MSVFYLHALQQQSHDTILLDQAPKKLVSRLKQSLATIR